MTATLELRGVSRDYLQGTETIHALLPTDLTIEKGEFVGILGPSGSGKSTLLTIMGGLRAPSTGTVTIDGGDFSQLPEKRRAAIRLRKLGFILQASSLVPFLTVKDQFVLHDKVTHSAGSTERRDELLDQLGLGRQRDAYPAALSGGERQRAAIAVALYHDPALVLADEPTASLDTSRALDVARILRDQTHERGTATVMVTHDERLLADTDRVLRMTDGVLTELTAAELAAV